MTFLPLVGIRYTFSVNTVAVQVNFGGILALRFILRFLGFLRGIDAGRELLGGHLDVLRASVVLPALPSKALDGRPSAENIIRTTADHSHVNHRSIQTQNSSASEGANNVWHNVI